MLRDHFMTKVSQSPALSDRKSQNPGDLRSPGVSDTGMTVDQMSDLFLARCRAERLSENTVSFYKKYLSYLQQVHGQDNADKVTVHQFRGSTCHTSSGRSSLRNDNQSSCCKLACDVYMGVQGRVD